MFVFRAANFTCRCKLKDVFCSAAMLGLAGARPETLVRHLPVIFDSIILLLVQPPKISGHTLNVGHTAFETLCLLLNNISVSEIASFYIIGTYAQSGLNHGYKLYFLLNLVTELLS